MDFTVIIPNILSLAAIGISLWTNYRTFEKKKATIDLIWEDLRVSFAMIVRNTGVKTLVIDKVTLYVLDKKKHKIILGQRENAWSIRQKKPYLEKDEAMVMFPIYGSIYDVFAYYGHDSLDNVPDNATVYISVTDIDGKEWEKKTSFTIGDINDYLSCAVQVEL